MSLRKGKLIVNNSLLKICVLDPTRPFDEWNYCIPNSVLLLREVPLNESIEVLYKEDYELIKEINKSRSIYRFWECLIVVENLTQKVWITPFSFSSLSLTEEV